MEIIVENDVFNNEGKLIKIITIKEVYDESGKMISADVINERVVE